MTAMKLSQAQVELERYYKDMIAKRPEAEQEQEDSTSEVRGYTLLGLRVYDVS